jgi:drug/metabolite transporter (DMT)-like permease
MKPRDIIDLVLLASLWGSSFLFMRVAAPQFGPIPLIEMRVAIGCAFLLVVMMMKGSLNTLSGRNLHFAILGVFNSALPFCLFAFATLSVTAGYAAVLNATIPLFGAVVAYAWLKERFGWSRSVGLTVGFAGVLALVWGNVSFKPGGSGWAVVAGLAASLSYGFAANFAKKSLGDVPPLANATGSQVAASVLLLPLALWTWPAQTPDLRSWLCALALGVGCTGIAYILYFRLIANVGAARAVAVAYLVPVAGTLWGVLFLSEPVTISQVVGGVVILLGVALSSGILRLPVLGPAHRLP